MAHRLTDTTKWDDDWFLGLPPRFKCLWGFLTDTCDGAGLKKVSFKKFSESVGEPITREEFDRHFAGRVHWIDEEMVWIHGVIKAQYRGGLTSKNRAHVNIAKLAVRNLTGRTLSPKAQSVFDHLSDIARQSEENIPTLGRGSGEGRATLKEERIKNKVKDLEGGPGETIFGEPNDHGGGPVNWIMEAEWCLTACRRFPAAENAQARAWLGEWRWAYLAEIGGLRFVRELKPNAFELKRLADLIKATSEILDQRVGGQAQMGAS